MKTPTTPKKTTPKKMRQCSICKITYKAPACYKEHQTYFHSYRNDKLRTEKIPNCEATRIPREHKCSELSYEPCLTLYQIYRNDPSSKNNSHFVDNREAIYESISHFRKGKKELAVPSNKLTKKKYTVRKVRPIQNRKIQMNP